ncbi:unnamed protein product [Linum trigynum]|uniref:Uncharacterized protein n=1 Tax=Linum trigynum TaxID=586398 RepID=A0AAV2GUG5_9ROSI
MPGSIQVSVLEFIGLQSLIPSNQIYVKVSLGKREYRTLNKGDFSFPLTTLRENVIVTLQDSDGNEISHTGVETRLLIQKGTWDDMFPLDGGGHIHLKLRFVLTEEDRERIRVMRETALRKKHDELVSSGSRSVVKYDKGAVSAQKNPSPNETDRCKDTASSAHVKEVKKERSVVFSTEGSIGTTISTRQNPTKKVHGSVKNMISAFESSAHQDMRTKVRQQMTKSQSVNNLVVVPSSESKLQKVRSTESLSEKLGSTLSQHNGAGEIHMMEEKTVSEDLAKRTSTSYLLNQDTSSKVRPSMSKFQPSDSLVDVPSSEGSTLGSKTQKVRSIANEILVNEQKKDSEDLVRWETACERASFSGAIHDHHSDSSLAMKKHSGSPMVTRKSDSTTYRRGSLETLCDEVLGDDRRSTECSGAWIFPDQGRRLCVSTAGKQVLNVIGGFWSELESTLCPGNIISPVVESQIEHFVHGDTGIPPKENGDLGRESTTKEGSRDAETPRGPLGQVMRVAIMVGFTALVVFTRQRKPDR